MQTPEEIFIKQLEAYFINEIEFTGVAKRKVRYLLDEYRNSVSVKIRVVNKNFIVYRTITGNHIIPPSNKSVLDMDGLRKEFDDFCEKRNVRYEKSKKQGRSTKLITKLRTDFCNYVAENFLVSKSDLANFFGLNHATIHYYFNAKKPL